MSGQVSRGLPALMALLIVGCSSEPPNASAMRIQRRDQLVGGRRALGDIGDFRLSNGIISAVVQDVGHSRGFGVFGGSLIDVDLARGRTGNALGAFGGDEFTEMFPAFFLEAVEPTRVEVAADGSDGKAAIIRVTGSGANFISMTRTLNDLALGSVPLNYQVDYVLEPGKQYLKLVTSITNADPSRTATFPISVPLGFVTLAGEGQKLFVPGKAGYDMRARLDDVFKQQFVLNALPGEVAAMVATEGNGISYGLTAASRSADYLVNKPDYYPTATNDSMLIPMASGSFLGTFWGSPPSTLGPGRSYSFTGYLAVGGGDIASVQRIIYELRQTAVGEIAGIVREASTLRELVGVRVVFRDDSGNYVGSATTTAGGFYAAPVPPGKYEVIAVDARREVVRSASRVEVVAGRAARMDLRLPAPASLSVRVTDAQGRPLPAKVSVEGIHEANASGDLGRFLFDLKVGDRYRVSDMVPDKADDPSTRRYLETVFFLPGGSGGQEVRPGQYTVHVSRGVEYSLASIPVELRAGETKELGVVLTHEMPTPDFVSGDFHVHSENSVDSDMSLADRIASFAAEGVDYLVATDHNFVSDLTPTIQAMRLEHWLKAGIGLELTTLEIGHFNAYPLKLDPGAVTHGSFNWFRRAPGDLFAQLKSLGSLGPENTLVQVNHPRDGLLGYFEAYNVNGYTLEPLPAQSPLRPDQTPLPGGEPSPYAPEKFSLDFNVLEVFNGKHTEQLHHYRIPADPGPGREPTLPIPAMGEILEETVTVNGESVVQPVYAGVLDDFYVLTAKGHRVTAVGNSDSHSQAAEAGLPRTYLRVGSEANGSMRALRESSVVDALLNQRAVVTNGPFVELWVNGRQPGESVVAPNGEIEVRVRVSAARWVEPTRLVIKRGGVGQGKQPRILAELAIPVGDAVVRLDETRRFTVEPDSFIVVEVSGEKSMWPVFTPDEIPPIQLTDAIGSIGTQFGLTDKYGRYSPSKVRQVTPFAFTNPVWVNWTRSSPQGLNASSGAESAQPARPRAIRDLSRFFERFHAGE